MPKIEQLLSHKIKGFQPIEPIEHAPVAAPAPVTHNPAIKRNPILRCPTPPLGPISVDNLQQYDLDGLIPQYRLLLGNK